MVVDHVLQSLRDPRMDLVFGALADPTRRDIVRRVLARPASVSELARQYPMSFAAVQKHVALLERADLVRKQRQGREQLVQGNLDGLQRATQLLDELESVWRDRLARFDAVLGEPSQPNRRGRQPRTKHR